MNEQLNQNASNFRLELLEYLEKSESTPERNNDWEKIKSKLHQAGFQYAFKSVVGDQLRILHADTFEEVSDYYESFNITTIANNDLHQSAGETPKLVVDEFKKNELSRMLRGNWNQFSRLGRQHIQQTAYICTSLPQYFAKQTFETTPQKDKNTLILLEKPLEAVKRWEKQHAARLLKLLKDSEKTLGVRNWRTSDPAISPEYELRHKLSEHRLKGESKFDFLKSKIWTGMDVLTGKLNEQQMRETVAEMGLAKMIMYELVPDMFKVLHLTSYTPDRPESQKGKRLMSVKEVGLQWQSKINKPLDEKDLFTYFSECLMAVIDNLEPCYPDDIHFDKLKAAYRTRAIAFLEQIRVQYTS